MTASRLDPFYLIVGDTGWIARLVPLGIRLVQLRVKDRAEAEIRRQVRAARTICEANGARLVVNDYWRIAIDEGCGFVHLGQEDLADADIPAIRRAGIGIGISTHDHDELDRARALDPDYIALGPIYPTRLKAMRFGPQGLEKIAEWKRLVGDVPLVAIGGLTVGRSDAAFMAGADIVSVVTDVTLNPDPERRVGEWLAATRGRAP